MSQTSVLDAPTEQQGTEHFDVLIVGAGISGIGSAYHLKDQMPNKSFVVLEKFETFGGTWHTHKYPGIRSDSDLYTFGYRFKPWTSAPIASADEIKKYMNDVITDNGLDNHIRYNHSITHCSWSSKDNQWTIEALRTDTNQPVRFTANFLWMCQGYYKHEKGYMPEWPDMDKFKGRIVHTQEWPEDLDYTGMDVIIIGSGATTATVVPAMASRVNHITVLQRSPTYFWTGENTNELADSLREIGVDEYTIHDIVRRRILFDQRAVTNMSFEHPDLLKEELLKVVREKLGPDYDVDTHFTPKYRPWQQRLAYIPNGDLFDGIRSGKASMETDEIERFVEDGVILKSGKHLKADLIIAATGFNLSVLGDIPFDMDGKPVNWPDTVTYRGMMFSGIPNMAWIFGYFRASWTLRVDIMGDFICRLLKTMDDNGYASVRPELRPEDADMELGPWIDPANFNPNYLLRSQHLMPKRGMKPVWQHTQDYWVEKEDLPAIDLTKGDDGILNFQ